MVPEDDPVIKICSNYVIGLLNLRRILQYPTTLERVIVTYKSPYTKWNGLPLSQRYWLIMDVNQQGDQYILMMETYKDDLNNWQTVLPSATKNFKGPVIHSTTVAPEPPIHNLETEVWFVRFPHEDVIVSALVSAKRFMEDLVLNMEKPGQNYVFSYLLHSESKEEVGGSMAARSLEEERDELEEQLGELDALRMSHARNLAKVLTPSNLLPKTFHVLQP